MNPGPDKTPHRKHSVIGAVAPAMVTSAVMSLALSACSVVGIRSGTPEPKYSVIDHVDAIEIRHYEPRIAAETIIQGSAEQARNQGFRRLAGYIFGGNHVGTKIAMTAPVAQGQSASIAMTAPVAQSRTDSGGWTIRFFMPAAYTMATLPVPNDPGVRLVSVPAEDYAALRFSGSRSPATVAHEQARLLAALNSSSWQADGDPVAWFYDPPWTLPMFRRNEVAVPVVRRGE